MTVSYLNFIEWHRNEWASVYVDGMLTFCLRLGPSKLFNALVDALEWCVAWEGVDSMFTSMTSQ